MNLRRPIRAFWLLVSFLLTQTAPLAALAATDAMAGMACCRGGKDSCCRRKPMRTAPAILAGHPCSSCAGTPAAGFGASEAAAPGWVAGCRIVEQPVRPVVSLDWLERGYDAVQFQRPPPVFGV
jgi:hypothetical protein